MSGEVPRWRENGFRQGMMLFDYPGYGKSGGTPSERGCYSAGESALHWLHETKRVAPGGIILTP